MRKIVNNQKRAWGLLGPEVAHVQYTHVGAARGATGSTQERGFLPPVYDSATQDVCDTLERNPDIAPEPEPARAFHARQKAHHTGCCLEPYNVLCRPW